MPARTDNSRGMKLATGIEPMRRLLFPIQEIK